MKKASSLLLLFLCANVGEALKKMSTSGSPDSETTNRVKELLAESGEAVGVQADGSTPVYSPQWAAAFSSAYQTPELGGPCPLCPLYHKWVLVTKQEMLSVVQQNCNAESLKKLIETIYKDIALIWERCSSYGKRVLGASFYSKNETNFGRLAWFMDPVFCPSEGIMFVKDYMEYYKASIQDLDFNSVEFYLLMALDRLDELAEGMKGFQTSLKEHDISLVQYFEGLKYVQNAFGVFLSKSGQSDVKTVTMKQILSSPAQTLSTQEKVIDMLLNDATFGALHRDESAVSLFLHDGWFPRGKDFACPAGCKEVDYTMFPKDQVASVATEFQSAYAELHQLLDDCAFVVKVYKEKGRDLQPWSFLDDEDMNKARETVLTRRGRYFHFRLQFEAFLTAARGIPRQEFEKAIKAFTAQFASMANAVKLAPHLTEIQNFMENYKLKEEAFGAESAMDAALISSNAN